MSHSDEQWLGSYYELSMQLSRAPDDARLREAVSALWSAPEIAASDPNLQIPGPGGMLSHRGAIRTPLGELPCLSWIIRWQDGGADWLDLSLPTGALDKLGLIHPIYESPHEVLGALDSTLASVAARVFAAAPFLLGIIGEEVSGDWSVDDPPNDHILRENLLLPDESWRRLGQPEATVVAGGLRWKPRA